MTTKELLERFSHIASPSGYEYMAEPDIREIIADGFGGVFDEVYFDKFGGCRLVKKAALSPAVCGRHPLLRKGAGAGCA